MRSYVTAAGAIADNGNRMRGELFATRHDTGVSRRALLFMPVAFAGLTLLSSRRSRPLPDVRQNGTGSSVTLVLFSDNGEKRGEVTVHRIVKTSAEWRRELNVEQYTVTRLKGTEPPYTGAYWNHHAAGLYRCACCGNALFRSREKFDSHTGWPSYWAPAAYENVRLERDMSFFVERTEVLCAKCDAHLGHVFDDGPEPTYKRYCINSAALKFVSG